MILEIPCTRLSRKIILAEHGTDPISLNRSHPYWVFIRPHAPGGEVGMHHTLSDRSSSFLISIAPSLAKTLREHFNDAGAALHRHHIEQMNRFVWANWIQGIPARTALRTFHELYRITDDDYDFDSAYRSWQRFRTQMEEKIYEKHCPNRQPGVIISGKPSDSILPTEEEVEGLSKFIVGRLQTRKPYLPCYVLRQVEIWLHVEYAKFSKEYIADKFGIAYRTVNHSLQKINGYLEVDDQFEKLIRPEFLFADGTH